MSSREVPQRREPRPRCPRGRPLPPLPLRRRARTGPPRPKSWMALGCLGLRILLFGCLLSLGATVKINDAARYEDLAAGSEARA